MALATPVTTIKPFRAIMMMLLMTMIALLISNLLIKLCVWFFVCLFCFVFVFYGFSFVLCFFRARRLSVLFAHQMMPLLMVFPSKT